MASTAFTTARVAYPNQRERALKYLEFKEAGQEAVFGGEEDGEWLEKWRAYAKEQGWPTSNPGEPKTEADFKVQFAMAGLCGVIGIALFAKVFLSLGTWIEADEEGISTSWGQRVPFDQIASINKKDWAKKGLARIRYADNGRTKRFVLDDFKFLRQPTDEIMRLIEQKVDHNKITGGPLEQPREEADDDDAVPTVDETSATRATQKSSDTAGELGNRSALGSSVKLPIHTAAR